MSAASLTAECICTECHNQYIDNNPRGGWDKQWRRNRHRGDCGKNNVTNHGDDHDHNTTETVVTTIPSPLINHEIDGGILE